MEADKKLDFSDKYRFAGYDSRIIRVHKPYKFLPRLVVINIIFSFLLIAGCRRDSQRKSLETALELRAAAIRGQNLEGFMESVVPDYNDGRDTHKTLKQKFGDFFQQVKILKYDIVNRSLNVSSSRASVFQRFLITYRKEGRLYSDERDEVLKFKNTPNGWKVYEGLNPL